MNKKEIIHAIEHKALNEFKDIHLDISNIEIEKPTLNTKNTFSLKKALTVTFASLFIIATSFFIFNSTLGNGITDTTPLNTETEILGFQTVSSAALLSTFNVSPLSEDQSFESAEIIVQNPFDINDEVGLISEYINFAETMLGSSESYIYKDIDSNNLQYDYAFEYRSIDFSGNLIKYTGYYNEEINTSNLVTVNGILAGEFKDYYFSTTTYEENGTVHNRYKISLNPQNYVLVTNLSSKNIQKFSYEVYKINQLVHSSEVKLYENNKNIEADMTITNRFNEAYTLEVRNQNENNGLRIQFKYGEEVSGEFEVALIYDFEAQTNKYQFIFDNETVVANRSNKGNKKASDSDFSNNKHNNSNQTTEVDDEDTPGNRRNNDSSQATKETYQI